MPSICPSVDFATLTLATRAELGASVGTVDGGAGGVEGGTQALGDGAESFAFPMKLSQDQKRQQVPQMSLCFSSRM